MIGKLDNYLRFHESALSLRSQRQEVLASNIANADTPNYKARDIDFASALQNVLSKQSPATLAATDPAHFQGAGQSQDFLANGTPLLYRQPTQPSADGNTVDMDVERSAFADNALRYETSITLLNAQIKGMLTAIQGGQ